MTGVFAILSFWLLFHADCGFDHVILTLPDAKFHSEANGVYFGAIGASVLELNHYIKICEGFVCFFIEVSL